MTHIFNQTQIKEALKEVDLLPIIEDGFTAYSQRRVVVPPVGEMTFEDPPGDVHIKYGYIKGDDFYVIKIASGFYHNPRLNLPSGNGLMLLFDQRTGELRAVLLDEGYLTDVRTGVAGAIAAKYLAPKRAKKIGILGTGTQGRMQLTYLKSVTDRRSVLAWDRDEEQMIRYQKEMNAAGFEVEITSEREQIPAQCNLIVTATASKSPLLTAVQIRPGTHITAMGSDTPEKNELDPDILAKADRVVADSISQCEVRGEIYHALKSKKISIDDLKELGQVIQDDRLQRTGDEQITVADLTGVAVQDIQVARAVYQILTRL